MSVSILALLIAFIRSGKSPENLRLPGLAGAYFAVHVQEIIDFLDYRTFALSKSCQTKYALQAGNFVCLDFGTAHCLHTLYHIPGGLGKSKHSLFLPMVFPIEFQQCDIRYPVEIPDVLGKHLVLFLAAKLQCQFRLVSAHDP